MLAVSSDAWLSLGALVLGFGLSQMTDLVRDRRQARERRATFQRETLSALQELVHDLCRSYERLVQEDLESFRAPECRRG